MHHLENPLGAFLVNSYGDRYLHAVNRNAFNGVGSDALYRSMYGDLFAEYQFTIIVGTDSGIFPGYIAKHGVPTGSRYLFVELPEVLELLSREGLLENLPEEICVTTLEAWGVRAHEYQITDYIFLDAVQLVGSLASSDANLPDYRNLSWTLGLELRAKVHQCHTATNCTMFFRRQIENLTENRLSFAQTLVGAFAGRTAIILAGGPSLQQALPWVQENRDRLLIIAVSRISRILIDQGIVPHIIATVDPQQISFEVSREMLNFTTAPEGPLLVNSNHASPLLVGQWPGKSVFTSSLFPWRTPLNEDKLMYTGPTVGNYALSLAMNLGCSEIILAGVDLCFSSQGQTHASGSNENKVGPDLGQISPRLATYGGAEADTNQGYAAALHVLGQQARRAHRLGQRIYNCSLSAAVVPLIDFKDLAEIELPPAEATPAQIIAQRVAHPSRQERLTHYRRIKKELSRARRKLQEILNLSHQALECADGLFGKGGGERDFRFKLRMDKIERRLDEGFGDFSIFVKQFGLKKFLAILKTPQEAEAWTDAQIESATRDYYAAYLEGTTYLIGLLDDALQRVESRIMEEKETAVFGTLCSQWEKDGQYGRLRIWRQEHPEQSRRMATDAQAERMEQEFSRIMTEERTSQIRLLEELHDVRHTRSKALLLFSRKELVELETMARGLAEHPNPEKATPYLHFVQGLIAELNGDPDQALAHYEPLLEEGHPLTEDVLQQIVALSLSRRHLDNALLTLECLTGFSPTYLPPYGDLLKAVGRFEDAFNAYNRYLGVVPDDVSALLKLGLLCSEAGLQESARELFQRVLALDAHNSAAPTLLARLDSPSPAT